MSRYIDAEWLKQHINTTFWTEIEKIIDDAPSIDIVFCKECKYRERCEQIVVFDIGENQLEGRKIDSCSYGERGE